MHRSTRVMPAPGPNKAPQTSGGGKDDGSDIRAPAITDALTRSIKSPAPRRRSSGGGQKSVGSAGRGAEEDAPTLPKTASAVALMLLDKSTVHAQRGVPWQLFHQVRGVFVEMLRRHHVVLSIFMAHGDAQLPLNVTQRVTVRVAVFVALFLRMQRVVYASTFPLMGS